jgi:hypothetical protein
MKLQERLPDSVTVDGKTYAVDLDFRNVLALMDTLARDDIIEGAKAYRALKCVMKHPPKNAAAVLLELKKILFPEQKKQAEHKKITDFEQDADLIRAAFMQAYGINLFRDRLHWLEFTCYLSGLPEGSRYCDILGIRARPMPNPTKYNAEERQWLMKAKAEYALQMTDKEQREQYARNVGNLASVLIAWAGMGGEGKDG